MAINSRAKGAAAEREFANYLKDRGHGTARRGQQFSGGADSPDVVCPTLPGVHFEVKRVEKGNLYLWLDQAMRDAAQKVPVVVHRKNKREWVAILPLDELLTLLENAHGEARPDGVFQGTPHGEPGTGQCSLPGV